MRVAELWTRHLLCYLVGPFVRPPYPRPVWKVSISSTKVYISQFMTASRSIYLYICGCGCIKICACMWGVLVVVLWFTYLLRECVYVHTAYGYVCRGASCVKLYVAGHLAMLRCAVGSCMVNYCSSPSQISSVWPPQPHCHHALCALSLSFIPVVWPRPTSAVQWRCCHVKDFTLATPHFLW